LRTNGSDQLDTLIQTAQEKRGDIPTHGKEHETYTFRIAIARHDETYTFRIAIARHQI
jgi:hypothetical protein